jgi:hypothetical protein
MIYPPNNFKTHVKNHKELNIVNVIKKKEFLHPQKNWWKIGNPNITDDKYYSSILEDKHYLYAFTKLSAAERCYEFLNYYRTKNNKYPDLYGENNSDLYEVEPEDIYIESDTAHSLKHRCMVNNIGLLGINEFDYTCLDYYLGKRNVFNLTFSAVDLLEDEVVDYKKQIQHYNNLFEI